MKKEISKKELEAAARAMLDGGLKHLPAGHNCAVLVFAEDGGKAIVATSATVHVICSVMHALIENALYQMEAEQRAAKNLPPAKVN
jgi:hypothetical protein